MLTATNLLRLKGMLSYQTGWHCNPLSHAASVAEIQILLSFFAILIVINMCWFLCGHKLLMSQQINT